MKGLRDFTIKSKSCHLPEKTEDKIVLECAKLGYNHALQLARQWGLIDYPKASTRPATPHPQGQCAVAASTLSSGAAL